MRDKRYVSILGDSVSTFQGACVSGGSFYAPYSGPVTGVYTAMDTWWMELTRRAGFILLANNSWAGSTAAESGNMTACSPRRIRDLSVSGIMPDRVLVFLGLNDVKRYVPAETFRSDYGRILSMIRDAFPGTEIVCGTLVTGYIGEEPAGVRPTYFGSQVERFNEAIREAAGEAGAAVADLAAAEGTCEARYASLDGLHPNGTGMRQLASLWLRCLPPETP